MNPNQPQTHPQHGVGVGVMVGKVAHVTVVHESHSEGGCVVRLALHPTRCLGRTQEVVAIIADVRPHACPGCPTLRSLRHREHHRLHTYGQMTGCNCYGNRIGQYLAACLQKET